MEQKNQVISRVLVNINLAINLQLAIVVYIELRIVIQFMEQNRTALYVVEIMNIYNSNETKMYEMGLKQAQNSNNTYLDNKYYLDKYIKTEDKKLSKYNEEDITKVQEDDIEIIRQLRASEYLERCMDNDSRKQNTRDPKKVNEEQDIAIDLMKMGCGCGCISWIIMGMAFFVMLL